MAKPTGAENVGGIYYTVELDTSKMIAGQREAEKAVDKLGTTMTSVAKATKLHVDAVQLEAQVAREAAGSNQLLTAAVEKAADAMRESSAAAGAAADAVAGSEAAMTGITGVLGALSAAFLGAVAAVGALVVGFVQGRQESREFTRGLELTGHQSGLTVDQLNALAQQLDSLAGVTRGKAAEALNIFVSTGIRGGEALGRFTEAAIRMEQAGGASVAQTAQVFRELEKSPVQAALKLNEAVNFLTDSTFKHIQSLDEQGRHVEAARVAQDAYADSILSRTPKITENLGLVERGWRAVRDAAKEAWDAVLNVGRDKSPEDRIAATRQQIADLQRQLQNGGFETTAGGAAVGRGLQPRERAQKEALLAALQEQVRLYDHSQQLAEGVAAADARRLVQVEALANWEKQGGKFASDKEKMEQEIAQARQLGLQAGLSELQIEQRIAAIRASHAKKGGGGGQSFDAVAYLIGLQEKAAEGFDRINAAEQKALQENAELLAKHEINEQQAQQGITLIHERAQRERLDLQLKAAGDQYRAMEQGYKQEAELAKKQEAERTKGREFARDLAVEGDPIAKLQQELETKSALLAQHAAIDQGNLQLYAQAKLALEQETAAKMQDIRNKQRDEEEKKNAQQLQNYSGLFDSMAGLIGSYAGKQSTAYRAIFAVSKAFAIAESIVHIQAAIAKAADSGPFPANLAAMGGVVAATAGLLSTIQSTNYGGGRQYGGPAAAGSLYRINETGRPEMFTAANGSQYMLPTASGRVTPADQVGGGGVQVNVHNYAGADVAVTPSADGRIIDIAVRRAKAEIIGEIADNSGPTWTALRGATNVRGRM